MKTIYQKPETTIFAVACQQSLMIVSKGTDGTVNNVTTAEEEYSGGTVLSRRRRRSVWDDEEEMEEEY